jgi:hypothetical protein
MCRSKNLALPVSLALKRGICSPQSGSSFKRKHRPTSLTEVLSETWEHLTGLHSKAISFVLHFLAIPGFQPSNVVHFDNFRISSSGSPTHCRASGFPTCRLHLEGPSYREANASREWPQACGERTPFGIRQRRPLVNGPWPIAVSGAGLPPFSVAGMLQ